MTSISDPALLAKLLPKQPPTTWTQDHRSLADRLKDTDQEETSGDDAANDGDGDE
jgi:hypothetical protein